MQKNPALYAILFLIFLFAPLAAAFAQPPVTPEDERKVELRFIPEQDSVAPGETLWIAIEQTIAPRWHTYWKNPGDSGQAPRFSWDLPEGFEAGELLYPVPDKIPFGPLMNYGYEDRAVLLQEIIAGENIGAGPHKFNVRSEILVCADICIPEFGAHSFTLDTPYEGDKSLLFEQARIALPKTLNGAASYRAENGDLVLSLSPEDADLAHSLAAESVQLLPLDWSVVANEAETRFSVEDGAIILRQTLGDRNLSALETISGILKAETDYGGAVGLRFSAAREEAPAVAVAENAAPEPEPLPAENRNNRFLLAKALFFALLGGLILNLMPCVFPILSMKAMSAVKLAGEHPKLAAAHGFAYTAGILLCFAIIAGALIALKGAGASIGWGFQLQNPVVVAILAWLLFVIGLNLSGMFDISAGRLAGLGGNLSAKGGVRGSFFTGILATLVATPCTAPFMGTAMGFALTQPAHVSMTVFLALGFGLALPFLLLSLIPGLQKALPRPGPWMDAFKQFLAFPMFASSVWLVWVLSQQAGSFGVLAALAGMVALAFFIWLMKFRPEGTVDRILLRALAALVLIGAFLPLFILKTDIALTREQGEVATDAGEWKQVWSPEKLEKLVAGNEPVFVEMTAAWCITCKVNQKTSLDVASTKRFFSENDIYYLVGDWTNYDDRITQYLETYGRSGVPIYVFYGRRNPETGERPEPVVLPQILTPAIVTGTLSKGI